MSYRQAFRDELNSPIQASFSRRNFKLIESTTKGYGWDIGKVESNIIVDWGIIHFPDGQVQFYLEEPFTPFGSLTLECSITNSFELDIFIQIVNTLSIDKLVVKYFYGARSDKNKQGNKIVANVAAIFSNILASTGIKDITIWNPHCEISKDINWVSYPKIIVPIPADISQIEFLGVIYPDESAYRRMHSHFPNLTSIVCCKERDQVSSRIIKHVVPRLEKGKYLVVDDLCDGGATFISLADQIPNAELYLYVTHGVFSKGLDELKERFVKIWASSSYPGNEEVK